MSDTPFLFSVCTLVTSQKMYESMKLSFKDAGFADSDCEFLNIDNTSGNQHDAYYGLNKLIVKASAEYIIFCHQDIELIRGSKPILLKKISDMNNYYSDWGVLANCGGQRLLKYALCVMEGDGKARNTNNFPMEVYSVDEHFFIIKNNNSLRFSDENLSGFHLYGTDICLQAILKGFKCYAIEFKLKHFGSGDLNLEFYVTKRRLIQSYQRDLNIGWIQTTCTRLFISSNSLLNWFMNLEKVSYMAKKYYQLFPNK